MKKFFEKIWNSKPARHILIFLAVMGPGIITANVDKSRINTYPNPANTQVTFQLPTNHRSSSFQIIDIYGKTIAELPYKNNQPNLVWDCKDISSGVYFYQTEIEGINYSGKIIID